MLVGAGVSLSETPFFKESSLFGRIKWLNNAINKIAKKQVYFYPGSLIKDKTRYFIENSNCSVGIFVNRDFTEITTTVVLLQLETDVFLLRYARRLLKNNADVTISILDVNRLTENNESIRNTFQDLKTSYPNAVKLIKQTRINSSILTKYSFMLISYQTWEMLSVSDKNELENIPSTLIINKKESRFRKGSRNKVVSDLPIDPVSEHI